MCIMQTGGQGSSGASRTTALFSPHRGADGPAHSHHYAAALASHGACWGEWGPLPAAWSPLALQAGVQLGRRVAAGLLAACGAGSPPSPPQVPAPAPYAQAALR